MSKTPSDSKPLKHAEDLKLTQRALAGEDDAVREFQEEYQSTLERVLMSRGVDKVAAEDLVADIMAECFGAGKKGETTPLLAKFEGRSSLSTWLIRITWNRWLDLKRRDKFRGDLPEYDDDEARGVDKFDRVAADNDDDDLIDEDLGDLMGRAIKTAFASLEPDTLLMLKLSYLHGISQTVLADMWRVDQTRISRTLSQAREQIASVTMREIKAGDPDIEIEWEDFMRLCAAGIEL
ncbi:MAG: sigma-70 family RNA polymerase sigma factor [Verrucomicrobiales bacterium]|nr:sigma-70 family RNA polymerase sigma factor [Verrucomicrobiales bacterium]